MTRLLATAWLCWLLAGAVQAQGFDLDFEAEADTDTNADADLDSDLDSESDLDLEPESEPEPESESEPEPEPEPEPLYAEDERDTGNVADETEATRAVRMRAAAGAGFGSLSYERPTSTGVEVLPSTPFGALDVLFGVTAWPDDTFALDVLLAYQTSVGMAVELQPLYALPEDVDTRFHRGEVSIAPVFRLGEGKRALALAVPIGIVAQFFEPLVHQLTLERYALAGPNARVELRAWLGKLVSVRVGPELQWIMILNQGLSDAGACCQGYAIGAQGAIEAAVGPVFRASLAYREARAFAPAGAWRFKSVERFLTARIAGEL